MALDVRTQFHSVQLLQIAIKEKKLVNFEIIKVT